MIKPYLLITLTFCLSIPMMGQLYFPPTTGGEWNTMNPADLGWCQERIDSLLTFVGKSNTKGFIVLKDGKIVLEKYYQDFTVSDSWYWASAGKSLTAALVGIAAQEGKLQLTDKSSKYLGAGFTSLTPEQEDRITVWNQLTMTSGLDDGTGDPHCTLPACLKYKADAGTRWAYHNAPYTLLDGVIAGATGMQINAYLASKVKSITGMDGGYFKSGYNNVMASTTRSAARFGLLMLNNGTWDDTDVLTEKAFVQQATNTSQQLNKSYGFLWWLNGKESFMLPTVQFVFNGSLSPDAPTDMYSALGKNDQIIDVVPSKNMVVVRFGEPVSADGKELSVTFNNDLWQYINRLECTSGVGEIPGEHCQVFTSADGAEIELRCSAVSPHSQLEFVSIIGETFPVSGGQGRISTNGLSSGLYALRVKGAGQHVHTFFK